MLTLGRTQAFGPARSSSGRAAVAPRPCVASSVLLSGASLQQRQAGEWESYL